jgi:hypothetical protein
MGMLRASKLCLPAERPPKKKIKKIKKKKRKRELHLEESQQRGKPTKH